MCSVHFISGKPAALYDKHNPDWIPNQKMGYEVSNIVNVDRYQRNKRRKLCAQSTSPAAHSLCIPASSAQSTSPSPQSSCIPTSSSSLYNPVSPPNPFPTASSFSSLGSTFIDESCQTDTTGEVMDEISKSLNDYKRVNSSLRLEISDLKSNQDLMTPEVFKES